MTADNKLHLYGAIEKFDTAADGTLMVSGIASSEDVDAQGEIITADAMRQALPHYLQKGSVREMHQPSAVGVPISAHVDDDGKTHFTAHVVDREAIEKVKAGVYKGFSIWGDALARVGKTVTRLFLKTIDLVDIPANPTAYFTVIKFDKPGDACTDPKCKNHHESAVEKCSVCTSKMAKAATDNNMTLEQIQKIDDLTKTVEALAKSVETLSKAAPQVPAELTKALNEIGDLQKRAAAADSKQLEFERTSIIEKMQCEGRVVFGDAGVAIKPDELAKMDLTILKMLSKNAQIVPLVAKAIYLGGSPDDVAKTFTGTDGKPLTGDALIERGFEAAGYGDLNKMLASGKTKN